MADAVTLCLYRYCVHCSSELVGPGPCYVCPIAAHHARRMGNAGRCARDNNQPLPVFLAGITGSRGGEVSGTQARADGCYANAHLNPGIGHWRRHVETSQGAAEALRPLAGNLAALLFTLGIIGAGFLAIPIMSASAAYAAGEIFGWRVGINKSFKTARAFYAIIILSTLIGIAIDFANINAIKALFWSAVLNGLLAPFLLAAILIVATDRKLMRNHPAPLVTTVLVAITTCAMIGAALGMFLL